MSPSARAALVCSIAIAWANYLLTARWAAVAGSIHGPKQPFFVIALAAVSILAWVTRAPRVPRWLPVSVCICGCTLLLVAFFCWFPPATWGAVPFLDDWPPRFQSTLEGVALLRTGTFSGWRWDFLGGYPMVSDVTQDLTVWAAAPMMIFGAAAGFHLTHLLLFGAIPALVWWDLSRDPADAEVAWTAAGLAALFSANYSYFLIRSGDTNSLTGAVATLATLVAARAARASRAGGVALILALTLANYSHRGFFLYAIVLLGVDAACARDWRSVLRGAVAVAVALVAGLPVTWDLYRYPSYFIANNVGLHPMPFDALHFARRVYYNVELLVRPGRWFNDFTGLTNISLPILLYTAWRATNRPRFYAIATIAVVGMVRFNHESLGYALLRPIILLPLLLAPPLAWFIVRRAYPALAIALLAFCALYIQVWFGPVPHVRDIREFNPPLVDRLAQLPDDMVLIENAWHRDADVDPVAISVRTPFEAHFEALLPAATGKRLYAGMWDGWQWTPYRDQVLANGAFRGRALRAVPVAEVERELRRWNVTRVLVWSEPARQYFEASRRFQRSWQTAAWTEFHLPEGSSTHAALSPEHRTPSGAIVRVPSAAQGERLVIAVNYHPAWRAFDGDREIALSDAGGQLAFDAPRSGPLEVRLVYPPKRWLLLLALSALVAGVALIRVIRTDLAAGDVAAAGQH